jgi:hypothetical protein
MENELIATEDICTHYQVEYSFIEALHEAGLIDITIMQQKTFIEPMQMSDLERMMRMHFDLHINLEGIEAITHLLRRVKDLQQEMQTLRSRLYLYEDDKAPLISH